MNPKSLISTFFNSLPKLWSMPERILEETSTTETSDPILAYTDPNSNPITPAPTIINFFGISWSERASVEVIILFLSKLKNGNEKGFEPVAIIIFWAFIFSVFLSF